jgi:hypothetical protein
MLLLCAWCFCVSISAHVLFKSRLLRIEFLWLHTWTYACKSTTLPHTDTYKWLHHKRMHANAYKYAKLPHTDTCIIRTQPPTHTSIQSTGHAHVDTSSCVQHIQAYTDVYPRRHQYIHKNTLKVLQQDSTCAHLDAASSRRRATWQHMHAVDMNDASTPWPWVRAQVEWRKIERDRKGLRKPLPSGDGSSMLRRIIKRKESLMALSYHHGVSNCPVGRTLAWLAIVGPRHCADQVGSYWNRLRSRWSVGLEGGTRE